MNDIKPDLYFVMRADKGTSPDACVAAAQQAKQELPNQAKVETTMTMPPKLRSEVNAALHKANLLDAIGTVSSLQDLKTVEAAKGQKYQDVKVISPVLDESLVMVANGDSRELVPAAASLEEVERAAAAGATSVKIFPAKLTTAAKYFKDISAPLAKQIAYLKKKNFKVIPAGTSGSDDKRAFRVSTPTQLNELYLKIRKAISTGVNDTPKYSKTIVVDLPWGAAGASQMDDGQDEQRFRVLTKAAEDRNMEVIATGIGDPTEEGVIADFVERRANHVGTSGPFKSVLLKENNQDQIGGILAAIKQHLSSAQLLA